VEAGGGIPKGRTSLLGPVLCGPRPMSLFVASVESDVHSPPPLACSCSTLRETQQSPPDCHSGRTHGFRSAPSSRNTIPSMSAPGGKGNR